MTTTECLKRHLGAGYRFYRLFFNIFAVATVMPLLAFAESLQGPALFRWPGLLIGVQVLLLVFSGLLFLAGAWHSAYLIVGAILEERKLLKDFGDEYRAYQKLVPMLVPMPWKRTARPTKHDSND